MLHKFSTPVFKYLPSCLNRKRLLLACILILPFFFPGTASGQQKRLGVISAYHESAPWPKDLFTAVSLNLADRSDIIIDPVYMNASLITDENYLNRTIDGVFQHFKNNKPDYLLLIGGMTITLRDRIVEEWGDIPMAMISKSDKYGPRNYYITNDTAFISDQMLRPMADLQGRYNLTLVQFPDLDTATTEMMLRMQPQMRKLVILSDPSYQNRHMATNIQKYLACNHPEITSEWLISNNENVTRLQSYLTKFNPEVGLLLCSWFYSRTGTLGAQEVLSGGVSLMPVVNQPVFTLRESYLKDGALAGYFPDFEQIRNSVNNIIDSMLKGASMRTIPFITSKDLNASPIVDYTQLQQKQIPASLCPYNTKFINKPISFWQRYKWQIVLVFFILIALILLAWIWLYYQHRQINYLKLHQNLIDNMPIGYTQAEVLFSEEGDVTDIQYHSGNNSFKTLLKENAIPGKPDKLFPAEYISGFTQTMLKTQMPVSYTYYFNQTDSYYEFRLYPPKGEKPNEGKIDIELFCINVTTRSKAENDLRQLTQKLDLTLNLAHIIPWRWDIKEHKIYCEAQRILKHIDVKAHYSKRHAAYVIDETDYLDRIHPDDIERINTIFHNIYEGRASYAKTEFRLLSSKENAHIYWLEINASVTAYDEQHHPSALSGSLLLITERKKKEQALITAREKAAESDRMKSVFLANMSHEIRTPLNAIVGFSDLIGRTDDEAKKQKFMNIIKTNNQLLLQLISDVLDLAKVEANTLDFYYQPVDLNELLQTIEKSVSLRVKPEVKLTCILGAEKCIIQGEPNRLSQVLINLLTNANKFTTQGRIDFGYALKGKEIYFFVKDTGLGISKENQAKLFQRFSKLNNFAQGTGLGLSICKGIIEKMEGHIGMESEGEGCGSKFWFTIPYLPVKDETTEAATEQQPVKTVKKKNITILVAEDNENNYMLFQSILEPEYKLIHAWDGKEAVEMFKEQNPQLILMDINMPKMDGYEATREIRKISASVPIIAITAYAFASDQKRVLENGFNGFMPKPIEADRLLGELRSIIGKSFILL